MKILVRAPNWLGDAVMATPFLKRLVARNPGAAVDVVGKAGVAPVYAKMPGLRRVLALGAEEASAAALRRERYNAAYVLPPSFSSAWHVFRAGVPRRVGHAADGRSLLLTEAVRLDERFHYVRRYLQLIGEDGRDVGPADFYFPAEEPADFPSGRWLAVAPGSRAPARRWAPERFAAVVDAWPGSAVILGAPDDAPWAAMVERAVRKPVLNLCGKTRLPLLGGILKRCAALVANESGLMHVAWAVGTPTVVVAGPSEPRCTSPFGARVRVLQHREIPCVPCVKNDCWRAGEDRNACLKAIAVPEVLAALKTL